MCLRRQNYDIYSYFRRCGHSRTGPLFLHVSDGEEDKIFYLKKCEKKLQILEITEITLILSVIYNSYINFNSY